MPIANHKVRDANGQRINRQERDQKFLRVTVFRDCEIVRSVPAIPDFERVREGGIDVESQKSTDAERKGNDGRAETQREWIAQLAQAFPRTRKMAGSVRDRRFRRGGKIWHQR